MRAVIIAAVVLLCVSCDDALTTDAKEAVTHQLRDPQSAQFRNLRRCARANVEGLEGEVNARTDRGGYAGFVPFMYINHEVAFLGLDNGIGEYATFRQDQWERMRRACWSDDQLRAAAGSETNLVGP